MSARDDLLSAARALIIAVTDATDVKVIHSGAKGPRPALPYVSVRVLTPGGNTHGPAERVDGLNGATPQASMRERREATISIQGFGSGSADWLDALQIGIDSPRSLVAQAAQEIAALILTPVSDISALLDTAEEARFTLELIFRYTWLGAPADQVELLTVDIDVDLKRYDGDADTLNADFIVTL